MQHGIQGQSKTIRPLWQKYEDENISKILGLPSGRHKTHWKQCCTLCDPSAQGQYDTYNTTVDSLDNGIVWGKFEATLGCNWCRFSKYRLELQKILAGVHIWKLCMLEKILFGISG